MTIKTWKERLPKMKAVTASDRRFAMEDEIGDLRANIRKLKKDAERFNFLCDCDNEQALDLLANHVGQREDLIELVDELIKEKS